MHAHTHTTFTQAISKLIPLLQSFSSKQPLEVLAVDLKIGPLSLLAAETNVRSAFTTYSPNESTDCADTSVLETITAHVAILHELINKESNVLHKMLGMKGCIKLTRRTEV